jgi:hypothetical protein
VKIVIEINDETLKNAIGQQLERAVASEIAKQMDKVIDITLNTKMARFTDDVMAHRVEMAARNMILQEIGRDDWSRTAAIKAAVERAAIAIVKERMK